ncbi:ubiquitin conjugating enzyme [Hirsutella rhossiliensis]|uniref:Ubiquitin conjugating enzyme n=1 Tax=Hirsutella rhossiliensis TaxID=111463 RepID=A0A9P8SKY7_9HYPO|nr:ubiquitin conjugating enzyme [Hirsutella rhossiliensis]KAH0965719.1 ubiquitin conjugating enzyme [Hirsutella rhossiliensis]
MAISLIRRAILAHGDGLPDYKLPDWAWVVMLLDLIVLLPVTVILDYTFKAVYPVFAMIEDENPPAYQPVSLRDALDDETVRPGSKLAELETRTVTSSFRAINRLLMANGGVMANFRGFTCALAQSFMTSILMVVFTASFGGVFAPAATLLASLALVQFSTAWVHIVISRPSPLPFWQRLPAFKHTFDATWRAVTMYCVAGISLPELQVAGGQGADLRNLDAAFFAKALFIFLVALVFSIFLVIPANVILVRIQASLLPPDEDTIIPFDRSFEGRAEPAVVGGRGFVTISDAWATFSKTAWRRLLTLYVKIFLVTIAGIALMAALILPEIIVIASRSVRVD